MTTAPYAYAKRLTALGSYFSPRPLPKFTGGAGIPQKTAIGDSESLGFQRADDPARIATLAKVFKDERNVTPNPLLVAERANAVGNVTFSPDVRSDTVPHSRPLESGTLHISVDDLHSLSLFDLMRRAKTGLEDRPPLPSRISSRPQPHP